MKEKDDNSEEDLDLTEEEIENLKAYDAFDPAQTIDCITEACIYYRIVKDTLEETEPSNEVLIKHLEDKKKWVRYLLDWFDEDNMNYRIARFHSWKEAWEDNWGRQRKKIYLMKSHLHDMIKIGYSVNPSTRIRTLAAKEPALEIIHEFEGRTQDERRLHEKYNNKRVKGEGEWFRLSDADVEDIKEYFNSSNEGDINSVLKPSSFDQFIGTDGWRVYKHPTNGSFINGIYT